MVDADASNFALGAVLSKPAASNDWLHLCAFYLRKLTPTEINCDVLDKELLVIKTVFEEWLHLLEGAGFPVQLLADHENFQYLKTARHLNQRQV